MNLLVVYQISPLTHEPHLKVKHNSYTTTDHIAALHGTHTELGILLKYTLLKEYRKNSYNWYSSILINILKFRMGLDTKMKGNNPNLPTTVHMPQKF
jgi:hypothetical protein